MTDQLTFFRSPAGHPEPDHELEIKSVLPKGGSTKPPPRFTQAGLVQELERLGIGRPSTYASIVDDKQGVLFQREYLAEEKKTIFPTPRGRLIDTALTAAFPDLVNAGYTAQMETRLDEIAAGRRCWTEELRSWYPRFSEQVAAAAGVFAGLVKAHPELIAAAPEAPKPTGKPCPACGKELMLRQGKKGSFLACSGYPTCKYTADPSAAPSKTPCPKCGKAMEQLEGKFGRYARCVDKACGGKLDIAVKTDDLCPLCAAPLADRGAFLGCSSYPGCSYTVDKKALAKAKKADKKCPDCGGLLVQKKGANGAFWGCSKFQVPWLPPHRAGDRRRRASSSNGSALVRAAAQAAAPRRGTTHCGRHRRLDWPAVLDVAQKRERHRNRSASGQPATITASLWGTGCP